MSYDIANYMGVNVTYGVLIQSVTTGGPAANAHLKAGTLQATIDGNTIRVGGDTIIGINGARIRNGDDLSTYLEENTLPGQTVSLTIVRSDQNMTVSLVLGARPAPTGSGTSS